MDWFITAVPPPRQSCSTASFALAAEPANWGSTPRRSRASKDQPVLRGSLSDLQRIRFPNVRPSLRAFRDDVDPIKDRVGHVEVVRLIDALPLERIAPNASVEVLDGSFCQGACGSQNQASVPMPLPSSRHGTNSCPRSNVIDWRADAGRVENRSISRSIVTARFLPRLFLVEARDDFGV